MKRRVISARSHLVLAGKPPGFTLVEVMVATALTLIMMGAVVSIFAQIGRGVSESRATLEATDRLRATKDRLQLDLAGMTAIGLPPLRPECCLGYLEVIEGPIDASNASSIAVNSDEGTPDTTVGDFDDVLMFTTHSVGRPFVGRYLDPTGAPTKIESDVAEIAWFVRGSTLYRRVLLVAPGAAPTGSPVFAHNDISVRLEGGRLIANSLGDLTKRECRYGHDTRGFPFDARGWGLWGLPTLADCSANWPIAPTSKPAAQIDFWKERAISTISGTIGPRAAEDVILTNVIGFDVKVWDPDMGIYVDLGKGSGRMSGAGDPRSGMATGDARVYCTWSFHYEHDGIDQDGDGTVDEGSNDFDDGGFSGAVDDAGERETAPPYPFPLRGIQVKIRIFEPDSRQIREVTVVQDFLPK